MNNPINKIKTFDSNKFIDSAAHELKIAIEELLQESDLINIALSGGSSPLPVYEKLATFNLEWDRIVFFLVDERCVPITSPESNFRNINKSLFEKVPSLNFPITEKDKPYNECAYNYEKKVLDNVNKVDSIPSFDLIILGMGLDGHTASLFPETNGLSNNKDLIILNNVPQLRTDRITMTYPLILNSKKIILIAKGKDKKEILDNVFKKDYPISKIIPKIHTILN